MAARDNVIFEHGLFAGRLGADRSVVVRDDSTKLKWPSDLKGFLPVSYESKLAKTDARKALEAPCGEIETHLRRLTPKPTCCLAGKRSPIDQDWWTYALTLSAKNDPSSLASTHISDHDGFEFASRADIGVRRPQRDTLKERLPYCAFRIKATQHTGNRRIYVALAPGEKEVLFGYNETYLALSDSHNQEGWGVPRNEFMARLPNLTDGRWHKILIDFHDLSRFLGDHVTVKGFRLRPGLKISHICTFNEKPSWLEDAEEIKAESAPHIRISNPKDGDTVSYEQQVEGTSTRAGTLQAVVFSGDIWHPQAPVDIRANGDWNVTCRFGYPPGVSGESLVRAHRLAILTGENPIKEKTAQLPNALGHDCISVRRR